MAVSLWKIRNTVITWCRGGSFHKCVLDIAASGLNAGFSLDMFEEGGKGGVVIPFHAQILTKFTRHVLKQSLSEKPQGNEIFTTKHK